MGWQVEYQGKDGALTRSAVFGSDTVAASYARNVKGGKVVPSTVSAPVVDVQKVPDADVVQAQRQAELDRLAAHQDYLDRERAAEAYTEAGTQARLAGASTSEALDVAAYAESVVQNELARPVVDALDPRVRDLDVACSGGCGRTVRRGFTMCRKCARA